MSEWIKINNVGRNICGNFIPTGTPYNFQTVNILIPGLNEPNFDFNNLVSGRLYAGWNLAPVNPSDDNLSIKLSSGSPITVTISGVEGGQSVVGWRVVKNKFDLSTGQQIPFNLFSGNTAFQSFLNMPVQAGGAGTVQRFSGYLPKEYDRLVIPYLDGGGPAAMVTVSGDFGLSNDSSNCFKIKQVGRNICNPELTNCIKIIDVRNFLNIVN
jgi:hypothetical protein